MTALLSGHRVWLIGLIGMLGLAMGCGTSQPRQTVRLPSPAFEDSASRFLDSPYPLDLEIGDVLLVQFPFRKDLDQQALVRSDGRIALLIVGDIMAAGRSLDSVGRDVGGAYMRIAYDPSKAKDRRYLLVPGDLLEVKFRSASQVNDTVSVRPDGRISLALVKSLVAEGKTPEDLQTELIRLYRPFLKDPDLVVIVRRSTTARTYSNSQVVLPPPRDVDDALVSVQSYAPRMVFVGGEVRTPGFVPYHTSLTALQSIIGAGGSLHTATLDRVIVLRKTGVPVPVAIAVDLATDTEGTSWNDFPLRPYDIVIVPMSGIAKLDLLVDQYLYQLVPAAKNINFTFFYNLKSGSVTVTP